MFASTSPELWFISPYSIGFGFLFIATHASYQIDDITKLLIDNEIQLAAHLSDEKTRFHVKNDCGVVYQSCISEENLHFIGGSIMPFLSKQKVMRRVAIPAMILSLSVVTVLAFLIIVMLAASFALLAGQVALAGIIGRNYQILIPILLVLLGPFLIFAIPLYLNQRKYKRIISDLEIEVKEIFQKVFPDHQVHAVENYYPMVSKQVPKMLVELLDQISESIPDFSYEQLSDYDISEYS